ncbi:hypothetical protein EVAR_44811_1 [Eumeta japonica]|uniref:Uncharacterized protein n=1 Tax=Eumeta variegata TaxID=151549 RepID=A0A4C1XBS1_EUMVA|nr:hypothetical protein EVAR_44811_1 [Eumeta japonica]
MRHHQQRLYSILLENLTALFPMEYEEMTHLVHNNCRSDSNYQVLSPSSCVDFTRHRLSKICRWPTPVPSPHSFPPSAPSLLRQFTSSSITYLIPTQETGSALIITFIIWTLITPPVSQVSMDSVGHLHSGRSHARLLLDKAKKNKRKTKRKSVDPIAIKLDRITRWIL